MTKGRPVSEAASIVNASTRPACRPSPAAKRSGLSSVDGRFGWAGQAAPELAERIIGIRAVEQSDPTRTPAINLRMSGPNRERAKAQARRETLQDKLARELDEHADEVVAAYLAGIRSDDPNRAYRAADAWISRVHGRPKETVENVTAFDDPLDVASMSREQRDALKRQILRQHPELAEQYMGIRAAE